MTPVGFVGKIPAVVEENKRLRAELATTMAQLDRALQAMRNLRREVIDMLEALDGRGCDSNMVADCERVGCPIHEMLRDTAWLESPDA